MFAETERSKLVIFRLREVVVPAYSGTEELRTEFENQRSKIRRRLDEFAKIDNTEYFYELVYCLLTPQSSAMNAGKAVEALRNDDLFFNDISIAEILRHKRHYIRFHNTKAKRLDELKKNYKAIHLRLCNGSSSPALREWLVTNVKGLGWKEASHFLRNIGHRNLAILDRHILKNLKKHGVIRSVPDSLTPKKYLSIEKRFSKFADFTGITMDELDLLFWSRETGVILK